MSSLRQGGASVGEVDVPGIELAPGIQLITINSERARPLQSAGEKCDKLGDDVPRSLEIGQFYLAVTTSRRSNCARQIGSP